MSIITYKVLFLLFSSIDNFLTIIIEILKNILHIKVLV